MTITAFKTERGAYSPDIIFMPTLESFKDVFARSNYLAFVLNSIYVSIGSTLVCFLFAIPAAYKMSFFPDAENAVNIALDVVDQNDACGRRASSDLPVSSSNSDFRQYLRIDHHLHPDESPDRGVDVLHLLLRNSSSHSGSGPDRRSHSLAGNLASFAPNDLAGTFFNGPDPDYLCLERSFLEHQPDRG